MPSIAVTQDSFEAEVLKADLPVLVDFWAEWCGPCKAIAPIIEEISNDLDGQLKVVKVDVDQAQDLSAEYQIMSIPTIVIFKGGEPVEQIIGALPKDAMMEKIKPHLG